MSVSTVHGRVSERPVLQGLEAIQRVSIATATVMDIFFTQRTDSYEEILIHLFDVEKPSGNSVLLNLLVSTNGATFETALGYSSVIAIQSATSVLTATGFLGISAFSFQGAVVSPFLFATASGKVGGDGWFRIRHPASGPVFIAWEWHFLNSASSPVQSRGSGNFASGPCLGIRFQTDSASTISAKAAVYGITKAIP